MNWRERDEDGDGDGLDIGLNLTLELKCPSQKSPQPKPSLNDIAFQSSSASKHNSFQGANMNKMLTVIATEAVVSLSPDSTISSANGKRSEREENVSERPSTSSEGGGDDESSTRKKLRLTKEQSAILEETFKHQCTLNQSQKIALARQLSLQTRQVEVWFQNRRARTKFKKTEVDCAYLKRRCEDLAEENRRLQKEVAELRALKYSANTKPATTLTMCPQCERLGKVPKFSPIASEQKTTTANWLINRL